MAQLLLQRSHQGTLHRLRRRLQSSWAQRCCGKDVGRHHDKKQNRHLRARRKHTHFLGCKHHVEKIQKDGHTINYIKYDMEKFLSSCCDTYEQLATECGQKVSWDTVATPFIEENDWEDLSRRPLADDEDGLKCPYCQGIYPEDCFEQSSTRIGESTSICQLP